MPSGPVEITVGGQSYRVLSDTDPANLRHLAALVDDQITECNPKGRLSPTQALLYAALMLAEQLEEERSNNQHFTSHARSALQNVLLRVDATIDATEPFFASTSANSSHTVAKT